MADSDLVMERIIKKPSVRYTALVPNQKGLHAAEKSGVREIAIFGAASETFSKKNINCSIDQSIENFSKVVERAKIIGMDIRGYVSCVVGCPYEGDVDSDIVAYVASRMYQMGCYEISLGDTIGVGTPGKTLEMIEKVSKRVPVEKLAVHFHDTYGQAIANIYASAGIRVVDSSIAGLGGCPYAKGASGNVATEDVVYLLEGIGCNTGIDMEKLVKTGEWISSVLGKDYGSKAGKAILSKLNNQ
ncbi:hypothetical protein BB558_000335 [Smittium angustum]|uniref:hydroxymethylglutaryl-CoA lyase n=1 Tax=Smittium angustum TaxID=133377 RepID=A0A2U1JES6_SMIAN|nr:hypothetical protein BB558_000335 [Smittium angustum]